MPTDDSSSRRLLTSWKEIAQFFGRSVRTVQEWEKREGLPVHRHRHVRKDSVYAYAEELDAWWRQHQLDVVARRDEATAAALVNVAEADGRCDDSPPRRLRRVNLTAWIIGLALPLMLLHVASRVSSTGHPAVAGDVIAIDGPHAGGTLYSSFADINGDGYDDLAFSAYAAGHVYLVFGGSARHASLRLPDDAGVTIRSAAGRLMSVRQTGDFNGDGLADLLLSEALRDPELFNRSASSYLVLGRTSWPAALEVPRDAQVTLRIDHAPDLSMSGCNLRGPSDLNGDGFADVWLSAIEYGTGDLRSAGATFVLFGRAAWPRELEVARSADVTFHGARMGEGLGFSCSVAPPGGTDRDRVAIFADEHRLWNMRGSVGRLYVFSRGAAWPGFVDAATDFSLRIDGRLQNTSSWSPAFADVNADGHPDLVAGISRSDDDPMYPGEVRIWFGHQDHHGILALDSADVTIRGTNPGTQLGGHLAVTDLDGDGIGDLLLPEPGRGELHFIHGRRDWPRRGPLTAFNHATLLRSADEGDLWQISAGDIDADHLPDLAVAAPAADGLIGSDQGRVRLIKPYVLVRLEVRPDHDPNPIVLADGMCVARVYGFSSASEDRIDAATVRLAGAAPTHHVVDDFDDDGVEDLQLYFQTGALRVAPDATRIAVQGRTAGGMPIGGSDTILIVAAAGAARSY